MFQLLPAHGVHGRVGVHNGNHRDRFRRSKGCGDLAGAWRDDALRNPGLRLCPPIARVLASYWPTSLNTLSEQRAAFLKTMLYVLFWVFGLHYASDRSQCVRAHSPGAGVVVWAIQNLTASHVCGEFRLPVPGMCHGQTGVGGGKRYK